MNPLLSSQNLFILRTINPRKPKENDLSVINEFDGFYNYIENQMAINVFGDKQDANKEERADYARDILIKMIGEEEFVKMRDFFKNSRNFNEQKYLYNNLDKTEQTVFKLIAKGFSQDEIAKLLDLTQSKVDNSKKCIYKKMNFVSSEDLMLFATKNNLV